MQVQDVKGDILCHNSQPFIVVLNLQSGVNLRLRWHSLSVYGVQCVMISHLPLFYGCIDMTNIYSPMTCILPL